MASEQAPALKTQRLRTGPRQPPSRVCVKIAPSPLSLGAFQAKILIQKLSSSGKKKVWRLHFSKGKLPDFKKRSHTL